MKDGLLNGFLDGEQDEHTGWFAGWRGQCERQRRGVAKKNNNNAD